MKKTKGVEITQYNYSSRGELLSVSLPYGTVIECEHNLFGRRIARKYADARMPVSMTENGTKYYLIYDQVGSLRIVVDMSGNVVKRIDYDSFGNVVSDSNPEFRVPFGFAGRLNDPDTRLIRFGYRDYDPDTSRWTAKDPIFFAGRDTNLYGYVLGDPVNTVDQNGLILIKINQTIRSAFSTAEDRASFLLNIGKKVLERSFGVTLPMAATSILGTAIEQICFVLMTPSDDIVNEPTEQYYLRDAMKAYYEYIQQQVAASDPCIN